MGRRGPAPMPTKLLEKRNSWRAGINKHEPRPPAEMPVKPDWLGPIASATWDEIVPLLHAARMISRLDAGLIARYCDASERWHQARQFLSANGEMYAVKDRDGRVKCFLPFPQTVSYHKLCTTLVRMEQELGLSPSGRSRVRELATPQEQAELNDALDFFLTQPEPRRM